MDFPADKELANSTLQALEQRGGSATIQDLSHDIAIILNLSKAVLQEPLSAPSHAGRGGFVRSSKFNFRSAWARQNLSAKGAVKSVGNATWEITEEGRKLLEVIEVQTSRSG